MILLGFYDFKCNTNLQPSRADNLEMITYTVVCEMAIIPRLFLFNEATIPTELKCTKAHINKSSNT